MSSYRIGEFRYDEANARLQLALEGARAARIRPLCLCRDPAVAMYVAHVFGHYVVKRMPGTGGDHASGCDSFEPPQELSGLGQVMGHAIKEDPDAGVTALKLGFALTKTAGRSAPVPTGGESDSVKTESSRLALRSLLHYLWEEAGFNRWSPAMEGRRNWAVVRHYLLQAAQAMTAKGAPLADSMYIPEAFHPDRKVEIADRRMSHIGKAGAPDAKGARRLMLVVAELKEIAPSRYSHKFVLKHAPGFTLMLNEDAYRRLAKRYEVELELWDAIEGTRMIVIATFGLGSTGIASIEEVALMPVTANWVPYDSAYEKTLLDEATRQGRRFVKGLRYQVSPALPLACLVLSDTQPEVTALYVVPPTASDEYRRAIDAMIIDSKLAHCVWNAALGPAPELPPVVARNAVTA